MRFEFTTSAKIIFGSENSNEIPGHTSRLGTKACVVTGSTPNRYKWILDGLAEQGLDPLIIPIKAEPETNTVTREAQKIRKARCDVLVAIGGGSVLDAGKALAALATNPGDIHDYLEVIGKGRPLSNPPLPVVAVPTTSGTGAEVTANAVLISSEHGVKISMRSDKMIPKLAVVDPTLTLSLPRAISASTGLDALTQLIEAFVSKQSTLLTRPLCRQGLRHAAKSLITACDNDTDLPAHEDMAAASLLSGIVLANSKLGAVHGLAAPIGGIFKAPHGAICAALLPHVMSANIKALKERAPKSSAIDAYEETARILTGDQTAEIQAGPLWIKKTCTHLDTQPLSLYGMARSDFSNIINQAMQSSSMAGNPVKLSISELESVLAAAL